MKKTKIVVKVNSMNCDKCRTQALKTAAAATGVISVKIDGDKVEVIGDGVDPVCLTRLLRKKFCFVTLESVGEVKEDKKGEVKEDKKGEVKLEAGYVTYPLSCQCYEVSYGPYNRGFCYIL
ncbi:Heavy metal-associated domain containing protein [Parasponia andersonii]|uniref:Heavy metal-associated domain containing protein n=1 Tax=Parasponia andersonii TaxID=3476 RepID=A0A2P5ALD2_PARAD|nr:Heavy metal-associated domain containing protein [Parasponia andersonii]